MIMALPLTFLASSGNRIEPGIAVAALVVAAIQIGGAMGTSTGMSSQGDSA